ncbi:MAG: DNA polymerase III subunit delta [Candidatus Nealsonbacteria bacterium]|nr:MAG: DNA polymerase III subunit delta [Candidatus Nealsonbacteria bacterium]
MIIFLYGQDTYRSRRKLNEIIEHHKKIHKSGLNLKYLNLNEKSFEDFKDEFQSISMFAEKKLIIFEEAFTNQNFKENFLKKSKKFVDSRDIVLFYETKETPRSDPLFKFLKKYTKSQEFELLEGENLKNWAKKEIENYKVKIHPIALEKLIDYVGNDLWQMANEIRKLVSYRENKKIEVKDIELLVKPKIEPEIFKTIDAIASKNKKQALELIHKHLEKGDNPLYLLSMINFQFRNLLTIRDLIEKNKSPYTLLGEAKLHPYVIKKSYSQAQKFKIDELKKIYQKIFQVDLAIKTGKVEPETALDIFIAEIC